MTYKKKLIEVALPLEAINVASALEKGNPFLKGHPRNLHQWWAMNVWFGDFGAWHKSAFVDEIHIAAEELSQDPDGKIAELGKRLLSITQG